MTILQGDPPETLAGRCGVCGAARVLANDVDAARAALASLFDGLERDAALCADRAALDASPGKMIGVALVEDAGGRRVLRAFSGDLGGQEEQPGWAPALVRRRDTAQLQAETWRVVDDAEAAWGGADAEARAPLQVKRREASRRLMAAMKDATVLTNQSGARVPLPRVFGGAGIPSGAGDCVVPKLLAAANVAGARVVGVAEAWWGPPHGERRHGRFEPPCAARCQPLLGFLLCSCTGGPTRSDQERAFAASLRDEGYAVVRSLLDPKTVDALQRATDALQHTARDFVVDTAVGKVFFEVQSHSGKKRETAVAPGALRKITGPSKAQPAFSSLRRDERVLRLLQAAGLRAPRCVVDQVNFKEPGAGTGFPFHQDASFLHGDARRDLNACGGLNLVIALDAADEDNGGFTVLGGTHHQGLLRDQHGYDTSTMNEGVFDESRRAVPALAPGDAVFFDPLLAHGSGRNASARRRRLVTLWFVGSEPRTSPADDDTGATPAASKTDEAS